MIFFEYRTLRIKKGNRTGLHYFLITLIFFTSSFKLYGENPKPNGEIDYPDKGQRLKRNQTCKQQTQ